MDTGGVDYLCVDTSVLILEIIMNRTTMDNLKAKIRMNLKPGRFNLSTIDIWCCKLSFGVQILCCPMWYFMQPLVLYLCVALICRLDAA